MHLRSTQLIAAAFFSCLLLWFGISLNRTTSPPPAPVQIPTEPPNPNDEQPFYNIPAASHLMGHNGIKNLSNPRIQMAKVHIAVSQSDMPTFPLMQPLDVKLPASTEITITDDLNDPAVSRPATTRTTVKIPRLPHTQPDASAFIFGLATTYERLEESLDTISHWSSNSNTKIIGHMQPSLDPDAPDRVLKKAQSLSVPLGTIESGLEFLDRYFTLLKVLYENRTPTTKWYVFIDDDTFFLSLSNLVQTFRKYDPELPWYIGALSEDFNQMATWGYMAYGGGGIFLSHGLVETLLPYYDGCFKRRNTGDKMLAQCIYKHTNAKLTWEHNLHQLDLHGDHSGFYEALRPQPLSIHHWKSEDFQSIVDVYNMSRVASVCGNSCILQKFRFANDWVLTNGYSIVKYSHQDAGYRDLGKDISMERTWEFYGGTGMQHFEHSLGPLRKMDEGGKVSFRMESAVVEEDGRRIRQLYVKRTHLEGEYSGRGEVEGVIEVEWSQA
ncbi:hypothetical protein H2198_000799 [Neophaeococcomyces mojaviensis]|uniref:Uncharacterized protein n=1 Tax=Neophaeococcomyces mojaviensis TaxID=3383035 RepID=A0ACC3AIX6_9EURO|nr:hypothetical protein H2198_000799 [Knufia sp. JES_112]